MASPERLGSAAAGLGGSSPALQSLPLLKDIGPTASSTSLGSKPTTPRGVGLARRHSTARAVLSQARQAAARRRPPAPAEADAATTPVLTPSNLPPSWAHEESKGEDVCARTPRRSEPLVPLSHAATTAPSSPAGPSAGRPSSPFFTRLEQRRASGGLVTLLAGSPLVPHVTAPVANVIVGGEEPTEAEHRWARRNSGVTSGAAAEASALAAASATVDGVTSGTRHSIAAPELASRLGWKPRRRSSAASAYLSTLPGVQDTPLPAVVSALGVARRGSIAASVCESPAAMAAMATQLSGAPPAGATLKGTAARRLSAVGSVTTEVGIAPGHGVGTGAAAGAGASRPAATETDALPVHARRRSSVVAVNKQLDDGPALAFLTPEQAANQERLQRLEAERLQFAATTAELPRMRVQELSWEKIHQLYVRYRILEDTATMPPEFIHAHNGRKFAFESGAWLLIKWELRRGVRGALRLVKVWRARARYITKVKRALQRASNGLAAWRIRRRRAAWEQWVRRRDLLRRIAWKKHRNRLRHHARRIQKWWRGRAMRRSARERYFHRSAVRIQSKWRGRRRRVKYNLKRAAARVIQCAVRVFLERRRRHYSAAVIQGAVRHRLGVRNRAARAVAKWYKYRKWRNSVYTVREGLAVVQLFALGRVARLRFLKMKAAAECARLKLAAERKFRRRGRNARRRSIRGVTVGSRLAIVSVLKPPSTLSRAEVDAHPLVMRLYFPDTAGAVEVPIPATILKQHQLTAGLSHVPSWLTPAVIDHVVRSTHVRRSVTGTPSPEDVRWTHHPTERGREVYRLAHSFPMIRIGSAPKATAVHHQVASLEAWRSGFQRGVMVLNPPECLTVEHEDPEARAKRFTEEAARVATAYETAMARERELLQSRGDVKPAALSKLRAGGMPQTDSFGIRLVETSGDFSLSTPGCGTPDTGITSCLDDDAYSVTTPGRSPAPSVLEAGSRKPSVAGLTGAYSQYTSPFDAERKARLLRKRQQEAEQRERERLKRIVPPEQPMHVPDPLMATPVDHLYSRPGPDVSVGYRQLVACTARVFQFGSLLTIRVHDPDSRAHCSAVVDLRAQPGAPGLVVAGHIIHDTVIPQLVLCRSCLLTTHRAHHKAGVSVVLCIQEAVQHHAARVLQRNFRNKFGIGQHRAHVQAMSKRVYRKEFNRARDAYDYRSVQSGVVYPFVPWSMQPFDIEPIPGWQRRDKPDGTESWYEAETGRTSPIGPEEAALRIQTVFRGSLHRKHRLSLNEVIEAVKFHNHARTSYFRDPDDFVSGLNYALLIHVVEQNRDGAMRLYNLLLKQRPKNKTLLTAFGLLMIADEVDDREQGWQQGLSMIQYCKANQQDYSHFELAAKFFFKFSMVVNRSSVMSNLNFALFQQFVEEDPYAAERYYKKALRVAPGHPGTLMNLAEFLQHRHPGGMFGDPGPDPTLVRLCTKVAYNSRTRSILSSAPPASSSGRFAKMSMARMAAHPPTRGDGNRNPEDVVVIPDAVLRSRGWYKLYNPTEDRPAYQNFWYNSEINTTQWRRPTFHVFCTLDDDTVADLEDVGFNPTPAMLAGELHAQSSAGMVPITEEGAEEPEA